MSTARPLYLGPRVKRLRRELGLTQQAMAEDLEISASYVALIERNQRPVTADLLLRLVRSYQLDMADFAVDESGESARRLAEVLAEPLFDDIDLPPLEIADLAASFPGISEALLRLYGAFTREQAALAEAGAEGEEADPVTELRRYLAEKRNFFAGLDSFASRTAAAMSPRHSL